MSIDSDAAIQVRLLDDKPAEDSSFKSHRDVSDAICSLILQEEEGKTVGLFGSWGSGKSTAAGLIEQKLKKQSDSIEVFTFDAWLHGTDPLRRSFIEKLIEFYDTETEERKKYIDKSSDEYVSLLDEITRRKEDQKVKTTPKIKPDAIKIGIAYVVTFSLASFMMKSFEKLSIPTSGYDIALYLVLSGIWLLLVSWPIQLLKTKWKDFASIIFNETQKDVEHTIIKTPDPTAIEFQRYFSKILSDAQKKKAHKFVIVLDNIDRLSDDEAIKMLTTMRSFFCENVNKNIWVLVPFDTTALKRIFSRSDKIIQSPDGVLRNYDGDNGMAEAFIDKTFSVKFYVAPPLVTDNKKYFSEKFEKAFLENISEDDKEAIFEIYEREGYVASKNTPRKIKTFINDLTSLYRIWQGHIDIRTLALYCLKRSIIEEQDLKTFLTQTSGQSGYVSHQQIYLANNEKWDRDFAAIYYGVEQDKALYVLAGDEIHRGLEEGRQDEDFGRLTNLHGFTQILKDQILIHYRSYCSSGTTLMRVSRAMGHLQEQTDKDLSFAWKILADHTGGIERWDEINENTAVGLNTFLSNIGKDDIKIVCKNIRKTLKTLPGNIINDTSSAKYWADMLEDVSSRLKAEGVDNPLSAFALQGDEDKKEFLLQAILSAAQKKHQTLKPFFSRTFALSAYSVHLNELLSDQADLSEIEEVICYLSDNKTDSEFKEVVDSLFNTIVDQNHSNDAATGARVLGYIATGNFKNSYAQKRAKELCAQGHIYGHFLHAENEKDYQDMASYLFLIVQYDLPHDGRVYDGNSNYANGYNKKHDVLQKKPDDGDELIENLLPEILEHTRSLASILVKISKIKEYRGFGAKLFQCAIDEHDYFNRLSTEYFIDEYNSFSLLLNSISQEYKEQAILKISQKYDFVDSLISEKRPFTGNPYHLYEIIFNQKSENGKEIVKRVQDYFKNMPIEEWAVSIKNWIEDEDSKIVCLEFLLESGEKVSLGAGACDALVENLEELSSFAENEYNANLLGKFPNMLYARNKKTFVSKLKNKIISLAKQGETEKWDNLIQVFGSTLTEAKAFNGDSEFLDFILIPAVRQALTQTLNWLQRDGSELSKSLNKDHKSSFKERLIESITSTDDENYRDSLINIATAFVIDPPKEKEEEAEQADIDNKSA